MKTIHQNTNDESGATPTFDRSAMRMTMPWTLLLTLAACAVLSGCRAANYQRPPAACGLPSCNCYKPILPPVQATDVTQDENDSSIRVRGQSPGSGAAPSNYGQTPNNNTANRYQPPAGQQPSPYVPPGSSSANTQPQYTQPQYTQPQYTQPQAGASSVQPFYAPPATYTPPQPSYASQAAPGIQPNGVQPYAQQPYYAPAATGVPSSLAGSQAAPFVTSQSNGVQYNNGAGVPPATLQNPSGQSTVGYGAQGTYMPDTISSYQVAPGVTGSIDRQGGVPAAIAPGVYPPSIDPSTGFSTPTPYQPRIREAPIDIYVQEARTGRIVLGGSVNSDLGLAGQVIIDERNFDYRRLPTSWADLFAGRAFRGAGQNFRAELMPGTNVQRYTVNFTQPHLFGYSPISFALGGFLFSRQFRDWTEQRIGGRMALGYDITRDLSATTELRLEDVKIYNPRLTGFPELDRVLGSNDVYTARFRLAHDTRDSPFMATEGHLIEFIYDQVFGEYDYPRGQLNYSRYFLIRERGDGGGRHTLASTWKAGITGADTPLFENFYAGGYSTLRGFSFRGASPKNGDLQVGGRTMLLGSLEYLFPLTADDMLRGILFVDYGALSKDLSVSFDDYRIAPGFGVRVNVPALGPAPLAFDFAFPVKYDDSDDRQIFSFFMGFTR